ncbi:hypothetical protein [Adhaeribacter rhizoryzae]|uniref:hypothetical protein n=1 Tax=Adhaeribacter rhizoryzae TaxID=2607907 RepID=UPI00167FDEA2|nr:hypothetical protein [Adhaeribacter rhizoryzae]
MAGMMMVKAMQKRGWAAGKSFGRYDRGNISFAVAHYAAKGKRFCRISKTDKAKV